MAAIMVKSKPHSDPARWVAIYPAYINSKKTAVEGRKIGKTLAVENPTCQEIFDIVHSGGFPCALERKMYPRDPERDNMLMQGRIRVQIKKDDGSPFNSSVTSRVALYKHVAELIPKLKTRQAGAQATAAAASGPAGTSGGGKKNKKKK